MIEQSKTNQIASNTIFLYLRMIVVLLITLYTSRVVLDVLGVEDYGIYNVVGGVTVMFTFFTSSLSNASQRYLSIELGRNDLEGARRVFNISLILYLFISILLLLVLETVGYWFVNNELNIPDSRLNAANWVFHFSSFGCLLTIVQVPYISAIIAREKMAVYAYLGIFEVIGKLTIVYFLSTSLLDSDKLILYSFLFLCFQLVYSFVYFYYCHFYFYECTLKKYWDVKIVKGMMAFISYNTFGCFAWSIAYQGASIIINIFFGPAVNAARGIAMQINSSINNFTNGIVTAVKPQLIKSYAQEDSIYLKKLLILSSKCTYLLLLFLSLPVVINIDFILSIWLKEVPTYANTFACLIIVDSLICTFLQPLSIVVNATGNVKNMQFWGRIITLFALPVSFVLLKFGFVQNPNSVFIILLIFSFLYLLYCIMDLSRKIDYSIIDYSKDILYPVLIITILSVCCVSFVAYFLESSLISFLVTTIMSVITIIMASYHFALNNEERAFVLNFIKKKFIRR